MCRKSVFSSQIILQVTHNLHLRCTAAVRRSGNQGRNNYDNYRAHPPHMQRGSQKEKCKISVISVIPRLRRTPGEMERKGGKKSRALEKVCARPPPPPPPRASQTPQALLIPPTHRAEGGRVQFFPAEHSSARSAPRHNYNRGTYCLI